LEYHCAEPTARRDQRNEVSMRFTLSVNGESRSVDVDPKTPLLWVLRDELELKGTKFGCGMSLCGACTVHVDGAATRSCTLPLSRATGRTIVTIEGLAIVSGAGNRESGVGSALHPVQRAWVELDVPQCGYCQAGQIMRATALLARTPKPTDAQIDNDMAANICRCGTYTRIRKAIHSAADKIAKGGGAS
jgi:isoquinoline 1-oxidoreductase subunit alpha